MRGTAPARFMRKPARLATPLSHSRPVALRPDLTIGEPFFSRCLRVVVSEVPGFVGDASTLARSPRLV